MSNSNQGMDRAVAALREYIKQEQGKEVMDKIVENSKKVMAPVDTRPAWKIRAGKALLSVFPPILNSAWQFVIWIVGLSAWIIMPAISIGFAGAITSGMDINSGHGALAVGAAYAVAVVAGFRGAWTASKALKDNFGGVRW